jgi:hypothetical protein
MIQTIFTVLCFVFALPANLLAILHLKKTLRENREARWGMNSHSTHKGLAIPIVLVALAGLFLAGGFVLALYHPSASPQASESAPSKPAVSAAPQAQGNQLPHHPGGGPEGPSKDLTHEQRVALVQELADQFHKLHPDGNPDLSSREGLDWVNDQLREQNFSFRVNEIKLMPHGGINIQGIPVTIKGVTAINAPIIAAGPGSVVQGNNQYNFSGAAPAQAPTVQCTTGSQCNVPSSGETVVNPTVNYKGPLPEDNHGIINNGPVVGTTQKVEDNRQYGIPKPPPTISWDKPHPGTIQPSYDQSMLNNMQQRNMTPPVLPPYPVLTVKVTLDGDFVHPAFRVTCDIPCTADPLGYAPAPGHNISVGDYPSDVPNTYIIEWDNPRIFPANTTVSLQIHADNRQPFKLLKVETFPIP